MRLAKQAMGSSQVNQGMYLDYSKRLVSSVTDKVALPGRPGVQPDETWLDTLLF